MSLYFLNLNITIIIITMNHHQRCASLRAVIDSHDGAREKVPDDWGVIQTICQRCILARLILVINTIITIIFPTFIDTRTIILVFILLRYESSTLILYKELSSTIFQSCQIVKHR